MPHAVLVVFALFKLLDADEFFCFVFFATLLYVELTGVIVSELL